MLKSSKPDQHETYQVDFSLDQQICSSKGFKYLKQVIPLADTERSCQLHLLNSHKKSPIESYVLFPSSVSSNSHLTSPIARSCLMILKIDCNKHFPPLSSSAFKSHLCERRPPTQPENRCIVHSSLVWSI